MLLLTVVAFMIPEAPAFPETRRKSWLTSSGAPMKWIYLSIGAIALLVMLAGCGGSSSQSQPSGSLTPATASVLVAGTVQLSFTDNSMPGTGYSWYVNGIANGNATVGTVEVVPVIGKVTSGGSTSTVGYYDYLYRAPVVVPSPATVTVTVGSQSPVDFGTATITVLPPQFNLGSLTGTFIFSLSGFDKDGSPYFAVGSFVADGNGKVTNGEEDLNSVANGYTKATNLTGSYTVGLDGRGTITLNSSLGSFTYAIVLAGQPPTVASLSEMDQSGWNGSGDMELQDSPFAFPSYPLTFVYTFRGQNSSGIQFASVGIFNLQNGALSGSQDMNSGGSVTQDQPLTGSYGSQDALGRGIASFTSSTGTSNIAYYLVSGSYISKHFRFVSLDAQAPFVGRAEEQGHTNFSTSDFDDNTGVFKVLSISVDTQHGPSKSLLQFSASNGTVTSGYYDVNDAGTISNSAVTGNYSVSSNGKVSGSFNVFGTSLPFSIYLIDFGPTLARHFFGYFGFYLDLRTNAVGTGSLFLIYNGGDSTGTWLGNYAVSQNGFIFPPTASNVTSATGEMFSDGNGNLSGNENVHNPVGNFSNQAAKGAYSVGSVPPGRGTASITTPLGTRNYVIYVTFPNKILWLDVDSTLNVAGEAVRQY